MNHSSSLKKKFLKFLILRLLNVDDGVVRREPLKPAAVGEWLRCFPEGSFLTVYNEKAMNSISGNEPQEKNGKCCQRFILKNIHQKRGMMPLLSSKYCEVGGR